EAIEFEQTDSRTYSVPITSNGVLEVSIQNFNGMSAAEYAHISILDDVAPTVTDYSLDDEDVITITLEDSQSGVDFETIYAVDSEGDQVFPISQDRSAGEVKFDMDSMGLTLHASDLTGNQLQVTFSTHLDNGEEVLNNIEGTETTILAGDQEESSASADTSGTDAETDSSAADE
ncbi:MAG TPA: hypothetical protein IAA17_00440, partial [Candidatus Lachnoclostridium stercorigallinarum]|nr:hypothetical protein [Candidatus Lachnoclostridium stercorigallinarum]